MLKDQEQIRKKENHRVFKQLLGTFIEEEIGEEEKAEYAKNINIIPKIYYDDFQKRMKIEFKIGEKQFYKVKNLPEFYTKMIEHKPYQYSSKTSLINSKDSFCEDSLPILNFMLKYAEIMKYSYEQAEGYNYYKKAYVLDNIFISKMGLDDLFETLKDKEVAFQRNNNEGVIYFSAKAPEIPFSITQKEKNQFEFKADIDIFGYDILEGKDYKYLLIQNTIYRFNKEFENTTLKILEVLRKNYTNQIVIDEQELTNFFSIIAPNITNEIQKQNISPEVEKRCVPKPLGVKLYLDYDKNNHITADIRFCYENIEINPLINENISIARNIIKENEALHRFIKTGFMLDKVNARLILANEDAIYNFLSEDIEEYMRKYEVLATDSFKKKEIHSFQMKNIGIRIENNLLEIDLNQVGVDLSDLSQMLQKYKLKKKFHRLKDGSYIKLEGSENMQFLEDLTTNMEIEPKELEKGVLMLPVYRTLYLDRMLKSLKNVKLSKDSSYQSMIDKLENKEQDFELELPKELNANLRNYQKLGYKWLKTLDEYHFGGILADDMGLRKNHTNISSYFIICYKPKKRKQKSKSFYGSMPKLFNIKLVRRSRKIYSNT